MAYKYRLLYFGTAGRGEPIRWMFAQADVPFHDDRITGEIWPEIKPKTPYGHVPVLYVDGQPLAESYAICRYLARQLGLAGKSDWEEAQCDATALVVIEFIEKVSGLATEQDEDKKKVILKKLREEWYPTTMNLLEKQVKDSGFLVTHQVDVTWADILFSTTINAMVELHKGDESMLNMFPKLKALYHRVIDQPRIKAWIQNRPKTAKPL